jgi:hypothetical protein
MTIATAMTVQYQKQCSRNSSRESSNGIRGQPLAFKELVCHSQKLSNSPPRVWVKACTFGAQCNLPDRGK